MLLHHYIFYAMVGIEILLLIPFSLNYRIFNKEQRLIFFYLIACVVYGIGADRLARAYGNNMAFVSIMMLVQFVILTFFYLSVLKNTGNLHKIIKVFLALACALFAADILFIEGLLKFNSIFVSFRTFVLIAYGVIFFLQLMRDETLIEKSIYINSLPVFWFNAGLFVNFCCSFLLSLTFNFIQQGGEAEVMRSIYQITAGLTWCAGIIQVILFYIGLLKIKRARA